MDNHSGISARQRDSHVSMPEIDCAEKLLVYLRTSLDSKVSMTDLVSAEDYVNLRVSTGLSAAIDEGRRRRR